MERSNLIGDLRWDASQLSAITADYERFADGLPPRIEDYLLDRYGLDVSSEYGNLPIKNPFGKASGQLSLNTSQVRRDVSDGLGFIVLKTIIAQDAEGAQSMSAWAVPETRMVVERIEGHHGESGWTVTWKGRGWYDTFEAYLKLFAESLEAARLSNTLIVPSCKYHLPRHDESEWKTLEYSFTTHALLDVWEKQNNREGWPMPLEKDFSPTLAGSDRAAQMQTIVRWVSSVTTLIRDAAAPRPMSIGLKLFNTIFGEAFQLELLRLVSELKQSGAQPDFLIYANRLFNPDYDFDGVRGVAYGGPDLSARNLSVLRQARISEQELNAPICRLPISATGNIESGKMAVEYLLCGASSFQMHTYFQLPNSQYGMRGGSKTARALHEIYFNPQRGLVAWLLHLRRVFSWPAALNIKQMADFCADPVNELWRVSERISR